MEVWERARLANEAAKIADAKKHPKLNLKKKADDDDDDGDDDD